MPHPRLQQITGMADPNTFDVVLVRDDGEELTSLATVDQHDGQPTVVNFDPVPFMRDWKGDAESIRSVVGAITAMHRARQYGR